MAFIGPLGLGIPAVAVHCDVCNVDLQVWPCYNCGSRFCGRCVFQHQDVAGVNLLMMDEGRVDPNEVAEGMHNLFWRFWLKVGYDSAADPAWAAWYYGRCFRCS